MPLNPCVTFSPKLTFLISEPLQILKLGLPALGRLSGIWMQLAWLFPRAAKGAHPHTEPSDAGHAVDAAL